MFEIGKVGLVGELWLVEPYLNYGRMTALRERVDDAEEGVPRDPLDTLPPPPAGMSDSPRDVPGCVLNSGISETLLQVSSLTLSCWILVSVVHKTYSHWGHSAMNLMERSLMWDHLDLQREFTISLRAPAKNIFLDSIDGG